MKKVQYPLLSFRLQDDAYLGMLVGTEIHALEKSPKKLKATLLDHLQKLYKKDGDFPMLEMENPAMKIIELSVRPTFRVSNANFPLENDVLVSTPLVYGTEEEGVYDCYLPLFSANFYCYDISQIDTLARHFMQSSFDEMSPDEVFRHARYPKPQLDFVVIKVKEDSSFHFDWNTETKPKVLERLAERYPYSKAVQRNLSPLPDAAWEMESYVDRATDILMHQKASLLVCGNPGTGKTSILKAAFKKLATAAKKSNAQLSFWRIRAQRITATAKFLGEWQETVEELVYELGVFNGILWVEDVVELLRTGSITVENSVAAYLLPFLQDGRLQMAGEVTPQQLESLRRFLPGFVESLQVLEIQELPMSKINVIFEKMSDFTAQNLRITLEKEAMSAILRLLDRFYPYQRFPGKGIQFLGECLAEAQLSKKDRLTKSEVVQQFIRRTGMPEMFLRDDLLLDQEDLLESFQKKIIGQPEAVAQLCDIIKVFKAGLNNPYRPIATLIFAGPTGVGKTASARALADYFFGKGQKQAPLIRIDMSEFQHPAQITRFLGEGNQPGKLVSDVREKPFAVLLLDEAEKATPAIFDAFMTVLDEGMLVDAFGRVTSFRNCIIILTTNLGASNQRSIGYASEQGGEAAYRGAIARFFRPEFINRIDNVVVFNPLGKDHIRLIATKELEEVKTREGFLKKNLKIAFTDTVVEYLAQIGFHEKYGARPLQRALEDQIVKPLANWLLKNPSVNKATLEVSYEAGIQVRVL